MVDQASGNFPKSDWSEEVVSRRKLLFKSCRKAIDELLKLEAISTAATACALLNEARVRVRQIQYLYDQCCKKEQASYETLMEVKRAYENGSPLIIEGKSANLPSLDRAYDDGLMAMTYAEAFYFFSFRLIEIFRGVSTCLFGKEKIVPEPKGVRDVRNHVIQHPNKARLSETTNTFSFGLSDGVVLRSGASSESIKASIDPGLHVNAVEFQNFILKWSEKLTSTAVRF